MPDDPKPAEGEAPPAEEPKSLLTGEEAPPEGEAPPEAPKEGEEPPKEEAPAPVEYTDFKFPEGAKVDDEALGKFKELAAKAMLSQEDAQAFIDTQVGLAQKAVEEAAQQNIADWQQTQEDWQKEVKADAELGGQKFPKVKATIGRAMDQIMKDGAEKDALREALDLTGAGNNPAIIRFIHRMASKITEASPGPNGKPPGSSKPTTVAEALYPNNPA